jgi:hypothetical protein
MRTSLVIAVATLSLAASACSKATQDKTSEDTKAAAAKVGDAAKDVAASPEVKDVGADLKAGAKEAASATKDAAGEAKVAAKDIASDVKKDTHDAHVRVEKEQAAAKQQQ